MAGEQVHRRETAIGLHELQVHLRQPLVEARLEGVDVPTRADSTSSVCIAQPSVCATHFRLGCLLDEQDVQDQPGSRLCSASHSRACEVLFYSILCILHTIIMHVLAQGGAPQDARGEVGVSSGSETPRHHFHHRHHRAGQADLHMCRRRWPPFCLLFTGSVALRLSSV